MNYNFDQQIERRGTGAYKYDALGPEFGNAEAIPMWIADMEFACPPFIVEAMRQRLEHPIFGYTTTPRAMWESIQWWQLYRHGWQVKREWLTFIPGIVRGIAYVINIFTQPGDKVIIQPPVYHPFHNITQHYGRQVVENPLKERVDGLYDMDLDALENLIDDQCKLFILCNPHNPGGVCWSPETLRRLAEICARHHLLVISDEIHADMTVFGHKHTPFATVSREAEQNSITFCAPSKVFNMPGVVCSYAVVPNETVREKFYGWLAGAEFDEPSIMSGIAVAAAYTPEGDEWRQQMLTYVEDNIRYVETFCQQELEDRIRAVRPEASFLIWLDCRALGLLQPELVNLFIQKAGLVLNDGTMFGTQGAGFMRLNVACPRTTLQQALKQLKKAINNLQV